MAANHKNHEAIWSVIKAIPEGKVASYGQIADLAGLPGRARLVGRSMGLIPDRTSVPWYRVLKSNGQLAGRQGSEFARWQTDLLMDEGVVVLKNRVNMKAHQWRPSLEEMLFRLDA
jgi:methylated-DNA-protein-cysteine methyltransferase-like protein